jgi:aldehyde:ferredoxin oxidoreductase
MVEAHQSHDTAQWKMGHRYHHSVEHSGQIGALINLIWNRDAQCHTHVNFLGSGLPTDLMREIADDLFGMPEMVDESRNYTPMNKGKAHLAALSYVYNEIHDSLTLCNYTLPVWCSPRKDRNYRGDMTVEAQAFTLATGIEKSQEDLEKDGFRIMNLFRALTARQMGEIDQRNVHDTMPDWIFHYPEDMEPFEPGSQKMDPDDMELAKDMLYEEFGWDVETGMPTRATLESLDLKDVADDLEAAGLLPG